MKAFSVTTDEGIFGFPVGKKVTLIKQEGGKLTVTYGEAAGTAPLENFTNDLDIAAQIISSDGEKQKALAERGQAWQQQAHEQYISQFKRSTPVPNAASVARSVTTPTPKPTPQRSRPLHMDQNGRKWHKGIYGQPVYERQ